MHSFRKTNRSAFLNFLRAKYEMHTNAVSVNSYPYYMCIDPNDRCQLRCPTCPTGVENASRRSGLGDKIIYRDKRSVMSVELFDAILDEVGEYLFFIMFYNYGEPLLNKHLPYFLKRAHEQEIVTNIHTNLSFRLSDEQIEAVLSSGLDELCMSIDGFSQETYEVHRVGGDFALVKENVERLVATRDRLGLSTEIIYNFLVFSFNEHEVPEARKFCEDLGIQFNDRDAFIHNPEWLPSHRKGEKPSVVPIEVLHDAYRDERGDTAEVWDPVLKLQGNSEPTACSWHYGYSVITAGGPVAPCCAVKRDTDDFGTIRPGETRFADVWNNERYRKSRGDFTQYQSAELADIETICTHCPYPKFLYHLYSPLDVHVITQFNRAIGGTDPLLEEAFDKMTMSRYGGTRSALFQEAFLPMLTELGNGDESNASEFVEYFESRLLDEFATS